MPVDVGLFTGRTVISASFFTERSLVNMGFSQKEVLLFFYKRSIHGRWFSHRNKGMWCGFVHRKICARYEFDYFVRAVFPRRMEDRGH